MQQRPAPPALPAVCQGPQAEVRQERSTRRAEGEPESLQYPNCVSQPIITQNRDSFPAHQVIPEVLEVHQERLDRLLHRILDAHLLSGALRLQQGNPQVAGGEKQVSGAASSRQEAQLCGRKALGKCGACAVDARSHAGGRRKAGSALPRHAAGLNSSWRACSHAALRRCPGVFPATVQSRLHVFLCGAP